MIGHVIMDFKVKKKNSQPNAASEPCSKVVSIKTVSLFFQLSTPLLSH